MTELLERPEGRFLVALGIGLVVGAERERRKDAAPPHVPAGIRTFSIAALIGWVVQELHRPELLLFGAIVIAGLGVVRMLRTPATEPSVTTELALLLTYLLGALADVTPSLAITCGLCAAALLAFRSTLHSAVRALLSEEELRDALLLAIAALVVLPLLPNRVVDPLGVLNPFRLWRLVVAFAGLSALGYVALRIVGPRYGLALAGFGSGFVSSAATVAALGRRAKTDAGLVGPAVAGATASCVSTLIQLAVMVGAADTKLLLRLAWPLGTGGLITFAYAAVQAWQLREDQGSIEHGRPFELRSALGFATLVTLVSSLAVLALHTLGTGGLLVTTALAGFADTHAAGAAAASVSGSGRVDLGIAELAVLLALTTNAITKAVLATVAGPRPYARRVIVGLVVSLGGVWVCYLLGRR